MRGILIKLINSRILPQILIVFFLGILLVLFPSVTIVILIFLFIGVFSYTFFRERFFKEFFLRLGLLLLSCIIGYTLAFFAKKNYDDSTLRYSNRQRIELDGYITSKEIKNNSLSLVISSSSIGKDVLIYCDDLSLIDTLPIHSKIHATGTISLFDSSRNPGEFDAKNYYYSRGILFKVYASSVEKISSPPIGIGEFFYRLRANLSKVFENGLDNDEASILSSITAGDKSMLSGDIKELFRAGGISHILCVSGMHISLLAGIVLWILGKCKINKSISLIIASIITLFYSLLCGMSLSTIRALLSFFIMTIAFFIKRDYDRLSTMSIIMLGMLIYNPLLCYNSGFIFSFWSVFSITVISELRSTDKLFEAIMLQLFSMPIVALYYYEIPVLSFVVNLLLVPFLSFVMFWGLLSGFIGLIFPSLATTLLFPCHIILKSYIFVCETINKIPYSNIVTGAPSALRLLIYFIVLFILVTLINHYKKARYFVTFAGAMLLLAILCLRPFNRPYMTFLDTGQGDGIFISDSSKVNYFIDGGSSSKNNLGKYSLIPFLKSKGISNINNWIVTHADSDHVSGLIELLEMDYPIDNIILSKYAPSSENLDRILQLAKTRGSHIIYASQGQKLITSQSGLIHFLWPNSATNIDDINACSLAFLYMDNNINVMFTGDISADEEKEIIDYCKLKDYPNADILKVAHHGSKYSSSEDFLCYTDATYSIISCGIDNRYHHPHSEALDRLNASDTKILRTDECGAITIYYDNNSLSVEPFIKPYN